MDTLSSRRLPSATLPPDKAADVRAMLAEYATHLDTLAASIDAPNAKHLIVVWAARARELREHLRQH